ncbi:hypothetical protein BDN71DRAFT_188324 [Pleurotus eryngii]|uniref:Uncharacterized protein n=1 Tax=Pleurotus eryngii TaxID=5323 RepID=A0A9P6DB83_PLEER|nr:hypothetical protein BDN71DRAFT_188324 [Pleurotus eryngii]
MSVHYEFLELVSVVRLTRQKEFTRPLRHASRLGRTKLATVANIISLVGLIVSGQFRQLLVVPLLNVHHDGSPNNEYWHLY